MVRNKQHAMETATQTSKLDINAGPRVAQALRLRRLGYTYDRIAQECGYGHASTAMRAIKKATAELVRDEAEALVNWQLDRIDDALTVVMSRIHNDGKYSLWAIDRLVPLLKRQAELLGLDAAKDQAIAAQVLIREYAVPLEGV